MGLPADGHDHFEGIDTMRIAFAKPRRFPGGQMTMALHLAEGLLARGHELLLLHHPDSPIGERWRGLGQPAAPVLFGRDARAVPVLRSWNALRRFRADVVMGFVAWPHDIALFMPAPSWLGVPVVVRYALAGTVKLRPREARYFRAAARFITVSAAIARELAEAMPDLTAPVATIHNGTDVDAFAHTPPADLGLPRGAVAIGYMGRLHEEKGLFDLATAWRRVADTVTDAHLLIIGTGPHEKAVRAAFVGAPRVRLLGYRNDSVAMHRALDMLVLPSHREGFPNVVVEAMAAGTPVVATRISGTVEAVDDGVTGRLVPSRDPDALAAELIRLATDRDERSRLGTAAAARAHERFTRARVLDSYEAELTAAVAR